MYRTGWSIRRPLRRAVYRAFAGKAYSELVWQMKSISLLHDSPRVSLLGAALLMWIGVWLHLTEWHSHEHTHEALTHNHRHVHDEHHQHGYATDIDPNEPHLHEHAHGKITHTHPHYPDIHHRHPH